MTIDKMNIIKTIKAAVWLVAEVALVGAEILAVLVLTAVVVAVVEFLMGF